MSTALRGEEMIAQFQCDIVAQSGEGDRSAFGAGGMDGEGCQVEVSLDGTLSHVHVLYSGDRDGCQLAPEHTVSDLQPSGIHSIAEVSVVKEWPTPGEETEAGCQDPESHQDSSIDPHGKTSRHGDQREDEAYGDDEKSDEREADPPLHRDRSMIHRLLSTFEPGKCFGFGDIHGPRL